MKYAVLLLVLGLSSAALAQSNGPAKGVTTTQNLTGSAPTLATDGVEIAGTSGFTVVVSANAGQTITGGSLTCYYYACVTWDSTGMKCSTFRWAVCPAALDFTPRTGSRDASSGDYATPTGYGRIQYVPNALTVSGGTTAAVSIATRKSK